MTLAISLVGESEMRLTAGGAMWSPRVVVFRFSLPALPPPRPPFTILLSLLSMEGKTGASDGGAMVEGDMRSVR